MNVLKVCSFLVLISSKVLLGGEVPSIPALFETEEVNKNEDAADDPAFWLNLENPKKSVIFGSDK